MSENKIKLVKNDVLDEGYYEIDHKSGLKIFVYPKENFTSAYALFGTNYGSIDTRFKRSDRAESTEIPAGTAHFLEHKLFESEELDAFKRYAETGASANAFTSFDRTCYLFGCSGNFKENFEILLDFVRHPYFTEETVNKEQGIIGQEIDMYKDSPDWEALFNLLGAMYESHPVRIDIAGTKESISKISAELLFDCYYTYYNLSNMALAVSGNVSVDEVLEVADKVLKSDEPFTVERKFEPERDGVLKHYVEESLPVVTPVFVFGYKEKPVPKGKEGTKRDIAMSVIREVAVGQMSDFYRELLDKGLINGNFGSEYFYGPEYAAVLFSGESAEPEAVAQYIEGRISYLKNTGISWEEFEAVRKKSYGKTVRSFSDIESIANGLVVSHFENDELFSEFDILRELELDYVNKLLKESFESEKTVLSVIKPNEE